MAYLNLDLNYFENPKTKRLIGLLGKGAEVLPIRLWCYCGIHHAESGRLTGYSTQEIESIVSWWGERGKMIDAMLKIGFLKQDGEEFYIHDWFEHEGHLNAFKIRAKLANIKRWGEIRAEELRIPTRSPKRKVKESSIPNLPNLPKKEGFTPPSVEEISLYCKERKNKVNANSFHAFYESKGWLVGKTPMKDWRAAVRTWEQRESFPQDQKPKEARQIVPGADETDKYLRSFKE